jgi:hypothetical protein
MNWLSSTSDLHEIRAHLSTPESDLCDHVTADPASAVALFNEDDSFGPVTRYVCCAPCRDQRMKEEGDEKIACQDCGTVYTRKEVVFWRWYDFYAPQGDEPLVICKPCTQGPRHKQRVARDAQDRRAEEDAYA